MTSIDEQIDQHWRRGRAAIDLAIEMLGGVRDAGGGSPVVDAVLASLAAGAVSDALAGSAALPCSGALAVELQVAIEARNRIVELAIQAYGAGFAALVYSFRRARDGDDDLANASEKLIRNIFRWRQEGDFKSWLTAMVRNSLRDDVRAGGRRDAKHLGLAAEVAVRGALVPGPLERVEKGTTTFGIERALQSFKDSLDPEKRGLWDGWARLGGEGMKAEDIYEELAHNSTKSAGAIKGILVRLQAEFRELVGAGPVRPVDASRTLALWLGSERSGRETAVLATGIDVDDNMRLLAMRQVQHVNGRAFARMLETLRRWRLPSRLLVVVDDSEGLREAIRAHLPGARVQACVESLLRTIAAELPPEVRARFLNDAERAYRLGSVEQAEPRLLELALALQPAHPKAAKALRDGLVDSLTVKRLGVSGALERQLTRVQFLGEVAPPGVSAFAWLGAVFTGLRDRRSVERRKAGLRKLALALADDTDPG